MIKPYVAGNNVNSRRMAGRAVVSAGGASPQIDIDSENIGICTSFVHHLGLVTSDDT